MLSTELRRMAELFDRVARGERGLSHDEAARVGRVLRLVGEFVERTDGAIATAHLADWPANVVPLHRSHGERPFGHDERGGRA